MSDATERRVVSQLVGSFPVGAKILNSQLVQRGGGRVLARNVAYFTRNAACMEQKGTGYQAGLIDEDETGATQVTLLYERVHDPEKNAEFCKKMKCPLLKTCLIAMAADHLDNLRFADPYIEEARMIYLWAGASPILLEIPE